jgi:hypothetical protein
MKKLTLESMILIKNKIESKLFNGHVNFNNPTEKQEFFDQYKMIVESAQKTEERRKDVNNTFITINWIFFAAFSQMVHLNEVKAGSALMLGFLLIVAIFISIHWLVLIDSFKRLNFINYSLIQSFENLMPTMVFSLRTDVMAELEGGANKGNVILEKETLIPKLFLILYTIYLGTIAYILI